MKTVDIRHIVSAQAIASLLLLSSCGGGDSTDSSASGDIADDECTPTLNLSTVLQTQVDINGNISTFPVANNTISGCDGSTETLIEPLIPNSSIETRFENTEDFDVWNCIGPDGANRQYALLSFDFGRTNRFEKYGFEFDPAAEDLAASQQLFSWRTPRSVTGDIAEVRTQDRLTSLPENSIESEWTTLRLPTEDDFSFTSSITGAMQCTKTISNIDIDAERWNVECEFRGPISACNF